MNLLNPPLVPRAGRAIKGARHCSDQYRQTRRRSLDDPERRLLLEWLGRHTDLPFDLKMIAGTGSGESLERREVAQAAFEVETATYDLVLAEDLGRIFRRTHASLFCEACEDVQTRLITINDNIDTARDEWQPAGWVCQPAARPLQRRYREAYS